MMRRSVPEEPMGESDCSTFSHSKIINIAKNVLLNWYFLMKKNQKVSNNF